MPYTKTVWVEKSTKLGPTNMNNIENGISKAPFGSDALANQIAVWNGTAWVYQDAPGREYSEVEITAPVSVTATTEATANTVITAAAITLDGATAVNIKFSAPYVQKGTTFTRLYLYDGAASIGFIGHVDGSGPLSVETRVMPTAVAHTYSIRASVDGGTGTVQAGTGVLGQYRSAKMSIVKV